MAERSWDPETGTWKEWRQIVLWPGLLGFIRYVILDIGHWTWRGAWITFGALMMLDWWGFI